MKLGSMSKMLAGTALALAITGGLALAQPGPRDNSSSQQNQKKPSLYPNATRKSPKLKGVTKTEADNLNAGIAAVKAGNTAEAQKRLASYAAGKSTKNDYVKAIALQALANLDYHQHNLKQAIAYMTQALATNALPNDTHFQLMYELAQFYYTDGQYPKALDTIHKWRNEGKRETADSYGLEGVIDYQLKDYKAAIPAIKKAQSLTTTQHKNWNQVLAASYAETGQAGQGIAMAQKQLAAHPDDAATRHNLIVLLMRSDKYDEALKAMQKAQSLNELTSAESYTNLAKLYLIVGQNSDKDPKPYAEKALAVITEGTGKGILKPNYAVNKLHGDANLLAGNMHAALAAYTKAADLGGGHGAADLQVAELLADSGKYHAATTAARKALANGTQHKGKAYMIIASAYQHQKNKPAAVKAMHKAAADPETSTAAKAWLHKAGY